MLEALAFLAFVNGLAILIPAIRKYLRMWRINRNGRTTLGEVVETNSHWNVLAGPLGGISYNATIHYFPPGAREPYAIFVTYYSLAQGKAYSQGQGVEVIYDADAPYRAFSKPEWRTTQRDFRNVLLSILLTVGLILLSAWIRAVYGNPS